MQLDEPVGGIDRVIIFIALVVGEGLHQQGLGSPLGIGMLALNLGKAFGCGLVGAGFEFFEPCIVELGNGIALARSVHYQGSWRLRSIPCWSRPRGWNHYRKHL